MIAIGSDTGFSLLSLRSSSYTNRYPFGPTGPLDQYRLEFPSDLPARLVPLHLGLFLLALGY